MHDSSGSDDDDETATQEEVTAVKSNGKGRNKRTSEAVQTIHDAHEASKPKKTRDTYREPTEEWFAWCKLYQEDTGESDKER
jgi:hypothetical protein